MAEVLNVAIRETRGTKNARRQRASGAIPAILYGHGEECISLTLSADQITTAIRHGTRLVDLQGEVSETAFLKTVQWDPLGVGVLHVDLTRVREGESVEVTLTIELRGEAPGTKEGGVIEHLLRQVNINCPIAALPEKLEITINALSLDDAITLGDIVLPEGAELIGDLSAVVVQCVEPAVELEEEADAETAGEPEVIGRKPDEEEPEGK